MTNQLKYEDAVTVLARDEKPVLIDVVPAEYFRQEHIAGARNACVYEVTFLDQVAAIASDKSQPLIVYGSSERSLAAAIAAEKLERAGYTNVSVYPGGLEDWRSHGGRIKGDPQAAKAEPRLEDRAYSVDVEKSRIEWIGRSLVSDHWGTIRLASGEIVLKGGQPAHAGFTVDMKSMANVDIPDENHRQVLIRHLESDDFFDVERFPTARFELTTVTPIPGATPGTPNYTLNGSLTVKGVTHPIDFSAFIGLNDPGVIAADAHFDIDRTQWNVLYGSGRLFEKLGMHLVNDEVTIGLKIFAV